MPVFDSVCSFYLFSHQTRIDYTVRSCEYSLACQFHGFRVKVKNLPKTLASKPFGSSTGTPGITISINRTQSISRTYSCTQNVSISAINAAIGWSQSSSESMSISNGGSWKVPKKVNKKTVKNGILEGYIYLDRCEYKIMRRTVTTGHGGRQGLTRYYGKWEDWKTGCIACKARPYDVLFKTRCIYK